MLNRRALIKGVLASGLLPLQSAIGEIVDLAPLPKDRYLAGGFRHGPRVTPRLAVGINELVILSLTTLTQERYPVGCDIHSVAINPTDQSEVFGFAKEQPYATKVLRHGVAGSAQLIHARKDFYSSGHGVVLPDGQHFAMSEVDLDRTHKGLVVFRNCSRLKVEAVFDSGGLYPHEMAIDSDRNLLIVANGSPKQSCIAYIELQSGKLLERIPISDRQQMARHFCQVDQNTIVVAGWSNPESALHEKKHAARIFATSRSKHETINLTIPTDELAGGFARQYLSIAENPNLGLIAATCEEMSAVVIFTAHDLQFHSLVGVRSPKGIASGDRSSAFVFNDSQGDVHIIDTKLSKASRNISVGARINGSHIAIIS
jgi:hypothetical protein